ncbi:MAG: sulfate adenylyltransferase [Deltaproteobacteria bacterium]|nr:sulfate adenylyltransferase [Deltaproteobacteria bacterium]MBI3078392.1 sulfate adenylyltransferase [Deltaproteobacteria bacterium]
MGEAQAEARGRAAELPAVSLNARTASDLLLIAVGAYSPLEGFMGQADYESVIARMRLASGLPWPIPITLAVDGREAGALRPGTDVALSDPRGELLGLLHLQEVYPYDRDLEALHVYRTDDQRHPGVSYLAQRGDTLLGGPVDLVSRPRLRGFERYTLDPAETRALIAERGWRTIVGFQTSNPLNRAHEYIQKCALELMDGLLIHPLVGRTRLDEIPSEVRLRCYRVLIEQYYPRDRVLLAVFPGAMRYAGPREAVFHALIRQNYGCTHFIVGRDHAGVGRYYGPLDAHRIFEEFEPGELKVTPLFFEQTFHCRRCGAVASAKTCPHEPGEWTALSGDKLRELLSAGSHLPEELTRPEVAAILADWATGQ